jgi:hypothetical protein
MAGELGQFGDPPDPAYVRFKAGLKEHFGIDGADRWRWRPKDSNWLACPESGYGLEEAQIAPTDPTRVTGSFGQSWAQGLSVPDVWRAVVNAYDAAKAVHPDVVWNPWTGAWRVLVSHGQVPNKPPPANAGWYADPWHRYPQRYWNGTAWTENVRTGDTPAVDLPGPR